MLWFVFILCVVVTNLFKVANWMKQQQPDAHQTFIRALYDYFAGTETSQLSTTTVIFAELAIGATVIDGVPVALNFFPKHWAWVGLIACLSEALAPMLVKYIVAKFKAVFPGEG